MVFRNCHLCQQFQNKHLAVRNGDTHMVPSLIFFNITHSTLLFSWSLSIAVILSPSMCPPCVSLVIFFISSLSGQERRLLGFAVFESQDFIFSISHFYLIKYENSSVFNIGVNFRELLISVFVDKRAEALNFEGIHNLGAKVNGKVSPEQTQASSFLYSFQAVNQGKYKNKI